MSEQGQLVERLIEAVRARPVLYDPSAADYKDQARKADEWLHISADLGVDECVSLKSKWKNLRDGYMKYRKCTQNNSSKYSKYRNWPWCQQMAFLDDCIECPNTVIYLQEQAASPHHADLSHHDDLPLQSEREYKKHRKRRRTNHSEATGSKDQSDAIDYLFQSYAETFKSFTKTRQALLKVEIAKMFSQAEIEEILEQEKGNL